MIISRRPLIDLKTPLGDIPREWLASIEHRIKRSKDSECWLWTGCVDQDGEPILSFKNLETGARNTRRVKRVIAEIFWEILPRHDVVHQCGNLDCLNPAHFYVSMANWNQEVRVNRNPK